MIYDTHMLKEDAELWVFMGVDGGLQDGQENVLQQLAIVGNKVPGSENVTKGPEKTYSYQQCHKLQCILVT